MMSANEPYDGIRLLARIISTLIMVLVLYLVIQEYREELKPGVSAVEAFRNLLTSAGQMLDAWILVGIAFAGFILAYWKEGLGGGIAMVSFLVLFSSLGGGHFNGFIFMAVLIVSIPCILYIVYWWKMRRYRKGRTAEF